MQTSTHPHSFSEPVQEHWSQYPGGETIGTEGYEHSHLQGSVGLGQASTYERALRGDTAFQPLRHDTLGGMGEWFGGGSLLLLGLGAWAIKQGGIKFDSKLMKTGATFLTGWALGGIARQW